MTLYKFRSLEPIEYALDILLNGRVYCASFEDLNDPFEGLFITAIRSGALSTNSALYVVPPGFEVKVPVTITDLPLEGPARVCSLCGTMGDVRLWSHYAAGHTGMAIELDLEEVDELHRVEYMETLGEFGFSILTSPLSTDVLSKKTKHWEHEQEFRIISNEEFYDIGGRVTGVYMGLRMPELMQRVLLSSIPKSIPVYSTRLNESTVEVEVENELLR